MATSRSSRLAILSSTILVALSHCPAPTAAANETPSADPVAVLAPLVTDDTFAIVGIRRAAVEDAKEHIAAMLADLSDDPQPARETLRPIEEGLRLLRAAGAETIYLAVGLADIHTDGGPILVVHLPETVDIDQAAGQLGWLAEIGPRGWPRREVRTHGEDALLVGTPATLDRYASRRGSDRDDLVEPLAKMIGEGAGLAAVFSPGTDFRRVVRELWPELPGPLAPLTGELLADRLQRLELAVHAPPQPASRLTLVAADAEAAETFVQTLRALPVAAEQATALGEQLRDLDRHVVAILEALPPRRDDHRVVIEFRTEEAEIAALQRLVTQAADAAQQRARREPRMIQFKQIALAMHNYHDVNKHFPAVAAIRDDDGRPLLSWRVALLPYLEEDALYQQFRLDEPWDSPHNRALIEEMPAVYADPDPALHPLAREGKTTYQVPAADETIFHSDEGTPFREITDGTSNTILLIEVEPERAVIWTKPEDWQVDLDNPWRGVRRTDRDYFTAALADGSVHIMSMDTDEKILRAHLTRAGREVVEWP